MIRGVTKHRLHCILKPCLETSVKPYVQYAVELGVNGGVHLNGALGRLIWPVSEGFHSRSADPYQGQLQIMKVIFRDYRANPVICRPTSGAVPRPMGDANATCLAGLSWCGWGRLRSSKVIGVVDKVSRPTCRSVGLLTGRVYLTGTSMTLVRGDPWVPMSLKVVAITQD
jgi:hypothetical protein